MPLGVLIALVSSAIVLAFLWNRNTSSFNVILADNFGIFVSHVLAVVGILTIAFSSQVIERDACRRASTTRSCCSPSSG